MRSRGSGGWIALWAVSHRGVSLTVACGVKSWIVVGMRCRCRGFDPGRLRIHTRGIEAHAAPGSPLRAQARKAPQSRRCDRLPRLDELPHRWAVVGENGLSIVFLANGIDDRLTVSEFRAGERVELDRDPMDDGESVALYLLDTSATVLRRSRSETTRGLWCGPSPLSTDCVLTTILVDGQWNYALMAAGPPRSLSTLLVTLCGSEDRRLNAASIRDLRDSAARVQDRLDCATRGTLPGALHA